MAFLPRKEEKLAIFIQKFWKKCFLNEVIFFYLEIQNAKILTKKIRKKRSCPVIHLPPDDVCMHLSFFFHFGTFEFVFPRFHQNNEAKFA